MVLQQETRGRRIRRAQQELHVLQPVVAQVPHDDSQPQVETGAAHTEVAHVCVAQVGAHVEQQLLVAQLLV